MQNFFAALHGCGCGGRNFPGCFKLFGCICRTSPQHSLAGGCIYKSSLLHSLHFEKNMECCKELSHIHPNSHGIKARNRKSRQEAGSAAENLGIYTRTPRKCPRRQGVLRNTCLYTPAHPYKVSFFLFAEAFLTSEPGCHSFKHNFS